MENAPPYSHPPADKEVLRDDKKLAVETNATLPQALSRDEKALYANSAPGYGPEVLQFEDTGKEVYHRSPETVTVESPLYPVHGGMGHNGRPAETDPEVYNRSDPEIDDRPSKRDDRRICGLKKWPCIFILVACALIVGVALGAGLGATLSKKPKPAREPESSASSAPLSMSSTPATATLSMTPNATTSNPAATPSIRDFRDRVKYNLTVYEGKDFKGAWQFIDRAGYYVLGFNASSYYWHCGAFTTSEMCSMAFCADSQLVAWRGGEDRVLNDIKSVLPDSPLPNRVKIMCGSTFGNPGCAVETYTMTPTVYPTPPVPDSTSMRR